MLFCWTVETRRLHDSNEGLGLQRHECAAWLSPKVIWIRLGNCTTEQIEDLLRDNHEAVVAFENNLMVGLLSLF